MLTGRKSHQNLGIVLNDKMLICFTFSSFLSLTLIAPLLLLEGVQYITYRNHETLGQDAVKTKLW